MELHNADEWFKAVESRDTERIMYNMSSFHKVTNAEGNTALILAAGRNHPEVVTLLAQLEYGMRNKQGYTALMSAAMYDAAECCEILLPFEKDFRLKDGGTALMVAAAVGAQRAFSALFPALGDTIDTSGRGALSVAASAGQLEIVRQILPENDDYQIRKLPHDMRAAIQVATANKHVEVANYLHQILTNHGSLNSTENPLTPRMKTLRELAHPSSAAIMVDGMGMTGGLDGTNTLGYTFPYRSTNAGLSNFPMGTRGFQDTVQCEHNADEICDQCLKRIGELNAPVQYKNYTSRKSTIRRDSTGERSFSQPTASMRPSSRPKSNTASAVQSPLTRSLIGTTRSGIGGGNYSKYDNYMHNTRSQLFADHEANMKIASMRATSRESSVGRDMTGSTTSKLMSRRSQVTRYPKSAKESKMPFNSDFIAALQDNRIPDKQNERPYNPVSSQTRSGSNSRSNSNSMRLGTRSVANMYASTSSAAPMGITTLVGVDSPSFVRSTHIDDLPGKKSFKYVSSKVDSGIGNKMRPYDFANINSFRAGTDSALSPPLGNTTTLASPLSYHDKPGVECSREEEEQADAESQMLTDAQSQVPTASTRPKMPSTRSMTSSSTKSSIHREPTPSYDGRSMSPSFVQAPTESTVRSTIRSPAKSQTQSPPVRSMSARDTDYTASKLMGSITNWQYDQLVKSKAEGVTRTRQANKAPYSTRSLRLIQSTGYTKSPTQGVTPPDFYVRPVNRFESDKKYVTVDQPYKDILNPSVVDEKEAHINRLSRPRSVTKLVRQPLHISKKESNLMEDLRKTLTKTLKEQARQASRAGIHSTIGPKTPGEALCDTLNRDPTIFVSDGTSEERQCLDIPYTYAEGRRLVAQYPESPVYCQDEVLNHRFPDVLISESSTDLMRKICNGEWCIQPEAERSTTAGKKSRKKAAQGMSESTAAKIADLSEAGRQANDGSTALIFAAHYNNIDAVNKLIDAEAGMTMRSGHTALMIACIQGSLDAAMLLAEKERNIQTKDGWTALMLCAKYNRYDVGVKLVPHECKIKNSMGNTALMIATCTGSIPFASLLKNHEGGIRNKAGRTALMAAVNFNCETIVRMLIDSEAGIQDNEGTSALMVAAQQNKIELVKLLAHREAKLRGNMQRTAMMMATKLGFSRVVDELCEFEGGLQDVDGWSALITAALMNNISIVEILREKEAGLKTSKGWTALMLASRCGYIEVVNLLVHREAGMQMENGWCAIMSAAINGYTDIVKLLFPYEGHLKDNKGNTPTSIAFKRGYVELYNVLNELSLRKEAPWKPM